MAHVLIGGVLRALAFALLSSVAGLRCGRRERWPGIGFRLFVDAIGTFVTSDDDYFYRSAAPLIYVTRMALVPVAGGLHGWTVPRGSEALTGAEDLAVAGSANGFGARAARHVGAPSAGRGRAGGGRAARPRSARSPGGSSP